MPDDKPNSQALGPPLPTMTHEPTQLPENRMPAKRNSGQY
ncbi:hypothetical protein LCGC14_3086080, partial [marine sediment metagenome]